MKTVWDLTLMEVKKKLEKGLNVIEKDHVAAKGYDQYNDGWDNALFRVRKLVEDVFEEVTSENAMEELTQEALKLDLTLKPGLKTNINPVMITGEKPEVVALKPDDINHPSHYTFGGIETLDYILAKKMDFLTGQVCKYISRAGFKDPDKELEDLKKAQFYMNRKVAEMEKLEKQKKEAGAT